MSPLNSLLSFQWRLIKQPSTFNCSLIFFPPSFLPPQSTSRLLLAALFGISDALWQENQKCLINKPPVSWCDSVFTTVGSFVTCQREHWADCEEKAEGIDMNKNHRHLLFIHSASCWYFIRWKFIINYDSDRARMISYKVETILRHGSHS